MLIKPFYYIICCLNIAKNIKQFFFDGNKQNNSGAQASSNHIPAKTYRSLLPLIPLINNFIYQGEASIFNHHSPKLI